MTHGDPKRFISYRLIIYRTNLTIKQLESLIKLCDLKAETVIHTDNGPEFTSKEFHEYVSNHPLLIGST